MKIVSGYKQGAEIRSQKSEVNARNILMGIITALLTWALIILAFGGWTMIGGK